MKNSILLLLVLSTTTWAGGSTTVPHTFLPNTPAVASQVNANFDALLAAVNDQSLRIQQLEAEILALQNNTVMELDGLLKLETVDGLDTAVFEAVNLQVINGSGSTNGPADGLGNVVIGYLEQGGPAPFFCATNNAFFDDEAGCTGAGDTWAQNVHTGSHNLVLGVEQSFTSHGAIVGGARSIVANDYSSVLGGFENSAIGRFSSVSGGFQNLASGDQSSVSGGSENLASGVNASVSGGSSNEASGLDTSVTGGFGNIASSTGISAGASISGGLNNQSSGFGTSITGGRNNMASGTYSSVTGGRNNVAQDSNSTVSGGNGRSTTNADDWVAGSLREDN